MSYFKEERKGDSVGRDAFFQRMRELGTIGDRIEAAGPTGYGVCDRSFACARFHEERRAEQA
jgi:hypothetical protein